LVNVIPKGYKRESLKECGIMKSTAFRLETPQEMRWELQIIVSLIFRLVVYLKTLWLICKPLKIMKAENDYVWKSLVW